MTEAGERAEASVERRRVLIVDDEANIREVLGQYLALEDFAVLEAADGAEALRFVERMPPDLVILDLMLPGIDGVEVCRRIRAASAIPIVMLTARTDEADKVEGFRAGTDDYVTSPLVRARWCCGCRRSCDAWRRPRHRRWCSTTACASAGW